MPDRATIVAERNAAKAHGRMLQTGELPAGLVPAVIESSWRRCLACGLSFDLKPEFDPARRGDLDSMRQRNKVLIDQALPIMETLYEQIVNSQSMVVLADANGYILHSLGDDDFLARAQRVALSPGVEWSESLRGTNAIGTALAEKAPVVVHAAQYFITANHFLTCSAAPLRDPYGRIVGVLDVTGDYRRFSPHTLALANMSARMIENRLFNHAFQDAFVVHLHARPEFLGTLCEGLAAFREDGRLLSANQSANFQFGLADGARDKPGFESLFGLPLAAALDLAARAAPAPCPLLLHNGIRVFVRIESAPRRLRDRLSQALSDTATAGNTLEALLAATREAVSRRMPLLVEYRDASAGSTLAAYLRQLFGRDHVWLEADCANPDTARLDDFLARLGRRQCPSPATAAPVVFLGNVHKLDQVHQAKLLATLHMAMPAHGGELPFALIASCQGKLHGQTGRKAFRRDLYERLSVMKIALPEPAQYLGQDGSDLDSITRQAIESALACTGGNISAAARRLGISRSTLYRRLRQP
jgi:transcriptional regulator of acetoin/glycerol metabolism